MPERNKVVKRTGAGLIPPLSPGDAFGLNTQYQTLLGQKGDILNTLALQRAQIRAAFQNQRAAIFRTREQSIADVENAAIGRGVLGSSADLRARMNVRADAATQLAQAISERNNALLANRAAAAQARRDYEMGIANIQAQQSALQYTQTLNDFLANIGIGPGSLAGTGISQEQKVRLRHLGRNIMDLAQQWAYSPSGVERQKLYQQLQDAWKRRNALRAKFGLTPIPWSKLGQYLYTLTHEAQAARGM